MTEDDKIYITYLEAYAVTRSGGHILNYTCAFPIQESLARAFGAHHAASGMLPADKTRVLETCNTWAKGPK